MKQYLIFAGESFFPGYGWEDFVGSFNTLTEAENEIPYIKKEIDWWQIVDLKSCEIIKSSKHEISN